MKSHKAKKVKANLKNKAAKNRKKILVKPVKRSVVKKAATLKKNIKTAKFLKTAIRPAKKPAVRKAGKGADKKELPQVSPFIPQNLFKAKIKVVGIGGGGGSIVSEIGRYLHKATFVIADSDIRALKKKTGIKYFCFGNDLTHGLGTGADPELGKKAAEEAKEKIANIFKDQDIVIFVASLGGGIGSGATQIFAEAAQNFGGITFGIFTLPFKFEGKNKTRIAFKALKDLQSCLNVSITIPNERIFKVIDINTPITQAFSMVNKNLVESLESLIDLIYNPGVINIDFADLRTILKGRGNLAFVNTLEESGKDRAEKISQKIFENPLYQNNNFTADKILFNIAGGGNLSMFEVEKISRSISELNPNAKIIFGISKNPKLKSRIKTTLLMTGPGQQKPLAEIKKEPAAKEPIKEAEHKKEEKKLIKKPALKAPKKASKPKQKPKEKIQAGRQPLPQIGSFVPSLNKIQISSRQSELTGGRLNITELSKEAGSAGQTPSKTIRRTGLDIKKEQEIEENKKIIQEKEWEIPAFLRFKKGKI